MKDEYTILIDTREKKPLLFPENLVMLDPTRPPGDRASRVVRVKTKVQKLVEGDYVLDGYPTQCGVERKGSLFEVSKNLLSGDRTRAVDAFDRLASSFRFPYLVMEGHPSVFFSKVLDIFNPPINPGLAVDALITLTSRYPQLRFIWLPADTVVQRRAVGEWVARALILHAEIP